MFEQPTNQPDVLGIMHQSLRMLIICKLYLLCVKCNNLKTTSLGNSSRVNKCNIFQSYQHQKWIFYIILLRITGSSFIGAIILQQLPLISNKQKGPTISTKIKKLNRLNRLISNRLFHHSTSLAIYLREYKLALNVLNYGPCPYSNSFI